MKISNGILVFALVFPAGGLFAEESTPANKTEAEKHSCSEKCHENCGEKCEHKTEAECKKSYHNKKGKKHCKHCSEMKATEKSAQ